VYLLFRKERDNFTLLVSPVRSLPRLHLVRVKPRSVSDPHPLVLNLRSRLIGSRVLHVMLLNGDRVVELRVAKDPDEYRLIFELTGSSANLFFTDAGLRILAVYHAAPAPDRAQRLLLPGAIYIPPAQRPPKQLPQAELCPDASSSANAAAESCYDRLAGERRAVARKAELRSSLTKAIARAQRRHAAIAGDLRAVREAEQYRQKGDLVLANLSRLKAGTDCARLEGYDGVGVVVQLDPRKTPVQNAEAYFRRYKKAKAGLPVLEARMRQTEEELSFFRSRLAGLEADSGIDLQPDVETGLPEAGQSTRPAGANRRKSGEPASGIMKIPYEGWEILVGRSAAANDRLSTRLARPDDLWLHAEGLAGSHVLVRNPKKADIPPGVLVKAASLAAFYSKGKAALKVPVAYTQARFLGKPKGARPGLVTLARRRTLLVKPEDPKG